MSSNIPSSPDHPDGSDWAAGAERRESVKRTSTGFLDPRLGSRLGKYEIVGVLGRGGMGRVYEGRDTLLDRRVAVKLLPANLASDKLALKRFLSEAKAAARLDHPNTVTIYEVDCKRGEYFMAMQLVRGGSASEHLKTAGAYDWAEASRIIALTAQGLAAAHTAGVIHRDVKPSNILIGQDGSVKLSDFGLAKVRAFLESLTGPNTVAGTPFYMSPEQCQGRKLDHRTDIYSLGATYFALLTGRPPFPKGSPADILNAHCYSQPPSVRSLKPDVPEAAVEIVVRAMAKKPDDRFANAEELVDALEGLLRRSAQEAGNSLGGYGEVAQVTGLSGVFVAAGLPTPQRAHAGNTVGYAKSGRYRVTNVGEPDSKSAATGSSTDSRRLSGSGSSLRSATSLSSARPPTPIWFWCVLGALLGMLLLTGLAAMLSVWGTA